MVLPLLTLSLLLAVMRMVMEQVDPYTAAAAAGLMAVGLPRMPYEGTEVVVPEDGGGSDAGGDQVHATYRVRWHAGLFCA